MDNSKCYDKWWLRKDMENMGYLFEYCDKYCKELFGININKLKFLNAFMTSNIRKEMELGHERLLSQAAIDTVEMFINVDCDGNCKKFEHKGYNKQYVYNQMYWVGWMYAYMHFKSLLSSEELVKKVSIDSMLEHYNLGHELDREVFYNKIKDFL